MNESLQLYLSAFIDDEHLIPLKRALHDVPHTHRSISASRARQGKLDAAKLEHAWFTASMRALKEYIKEIEHSSEKG